MTRRLLALGLFVVFACGKDGGIDSGLPPGQPGNALTPGDQTTLCEAAQDYFDARVTQSDWAGFQCTQEAIGEASEQASDTAGRISACKQLRDECLAVGDVESFDGTCDGAEDWTTCSASVGEIEACLEDTVDLLDGFLADFTCDILDPARAAALQEKYGDVDDLTPASCDVVEMKCPTLFGSVDDMASGMP